MNAPLKDIRDKTKAQTLGFVKSIVAAAVIDKNWISPMMMSHDFLREPIIGT